MKVAMLGSGMVGRALAAKLDELGHDVVIGTRDVEDLRARGEGSGGDAMTFAQWNQEHPGVGLAGLPEAGEQAEIVVNATSGLGSIEALSAAGEANLAGKVIIDIANPLDFSQGMPPTLWVCNDDSLGERIQAAFPRSMVVKALNTVNANIMVDPGLLGDGDHETFVSGNDADAKATVIQILRQFGWRNITDLGDITTARGTEMYLALWIRLMGALGTPAFNVKIVR